MKSLLFRKTNSKNDEVEFIDAGKLLIKIKNPKQRILPHDFIHALVENTLGISGFIDRTFAGHKPETVMQVSGEAWLAEAVVESIQGMLWSGKLDLAQLNEWVNSICMQRRVPAVMIAVEDFAKLEQAIEETGKKWAQLMPGQSLEFLWSK